MRDKLYRILIYILSTIIVISAHLETSYQITTITEDAYDTVASNSFTIEDHLKYNNLSIDFKVITFHESSGLSDIISFTSNISAKNMAAKNKTNVLHLSHVRDNRKNIFNEINWNRKLMSSDSSRCLKVFEESLNLYSSCGKYDTIYADALKILVSKAFVREVMIVVDSDLCSRQFASILKNSTYDVAGPFGLVIFHFVNDGSNLLSDLSNMLYTATVKSVTTIILLCSDFLVELIFRLARSSAISFSNVLWVALEYSSVVDNTLAPPLFLSISKISESTLPTLNFSANKLLATKAIASLAVEEKVFTKLGAIELVKDLINKTPRQSCVTGDVKASTVVVSLRQSKFTWTTLYAVGGDNTVTQLVEDKKMSWLSRLKSHKANLLVVTAPESPFVIVVSKFYNKKENECNQGIVCKVPNKSNGTTVWEPSCCLGSIMDLLKKLQQDLWLALDLHIVEDGFFGSVVDGKWNGMIGELIDGKANMAMATLTSTTKRSTVVDFGESYIQVTLGIVVASHTLAEMKFFNFSFVANVTGDLLLVLLFMFIGGLIVLCGTENAINHFRCNNKRYALREGFSYLSGITFQRDLGGKNPEQGATRIMFIVFAFGMVIIMTTYTATLTAVQVKQENHDLLTGIKDPKLMNPSDSFKFATIRSSSMQDYFRFSDNEAHRRINAFMASYNVNSSKMGVQKVLAGELQAFITEYPIAQYFASKQKNCDLHAIKTTSGQSSWNVAFQKNSPWKEIISRKILEYKEKGLLDDITTRWVQTTCTDHSTVNLTTQKYKVENFSGLVVIFACLLIVSIIILLVERWISKWKKRSSDYSFNGR